MGRCNDLNAIGNAPEILILWISKLFISAHDIVTKVAKSTQSWAINLAAANTLTKHYQTNFYMTHI